MPHDLLLKTGVIGSLIAALCCATPVLAVLLGALGLGWVVGYMDMVLLPVMVVFLGLVGYALWRRARSTRGRGACKACSGAGCSLR